MDLRPQRGCPVTSGLKGWAVRDHPIDILEDFFDFEGERPDNWPDDPDVRRAVEWSRGHIGDGAWKERRLAAGRRVYDLIVNGAKPGTTGRFFDERYSFVYQLYLTEGWIDHIWNYDRSSDRGSFPCSPRSVATSVCSRP